MTETTERVAATEKTALRVWLNDGETTALIEGSNQRRYVPLVFGPRGCALICIPGTRWALEMIAEMRGITNYAPLDGPDLGIIDEKRTG